MAHENNSVTFEINGVAGFLLSILLIALTVVFVVFGGAVLVVLLVGLVVLASLAATVDALSNLWFRMTHGGRTRREVALQERDARLEQALLSHNEHVDNELKAWMRKNNLPV